MKNAIMTHVESSKTNMYRHMKDVMMSKLSELKVGDIIQHTFLYPQHAVFLSGVITLVN